MNETCYIKFKDGTIIKRGSIITVSKITEYYPISFTFRPHGYYEYHIEHDSGVLYLKEFFRVKLFSRKPKNKVDKLRAYKRLKSSKSFIEQQLFDFEGND